MRIRGRGAKQNKKEKTDEKKMGKSEKNEKKKEVKKPGPVKIFTLGIPSSSTPMDAASCFPCSESMETVPKCTDCARGRGRV